MHLDTCWCINSVYIQNCGSFFFIVVFSNIFKGDIIGFYPLIILRLTLDLSWSNRSHTEIKYCGIIQVCKAKCSWVSTFLLVRGDVISWVSYAMAPEKITLTWFIYKLRKELYDCQVFFANYTNISKCVCLEYTLDIYQVQNRPQHYLSSC